MALRVVIAPTPAEGEAVAGLITLAQAKAQCRVTFDDDDDLLSALILGASALVEAETQRRYLPQVLEWTRDDWTDSMQLPIAPGGDWSNIEVNQILYADLSGDQQVLDPSLYWAKPCGATLRITPQWFVIWPWLGDAAERVVIQLTIGPNSAPSPGAIHATKLLVSHWYKNPDAVVGVENRDSSTAMPIGVESCLTFERWS